MNRCFAGTTLFDIACRKLQILTKDYNIPTIVSVYEPELVNIAEKYNQVNIFNRSKASSECDNGVDVMFEWWSCLAQWGFKRVIMFNACMPFLKVETIKSFYDECVKDDLECAFGVIPLKDYFWNTEGTMLNKWPEGQDLFNTKAVGVTYKAAHALYCGLTAPIGDGVWMCKLPKESHKLEKFPVNEQECLDIDYEWQFKALEELYRSGWKPE